MLLNNTLLARHHGTIPITLITPRVYRDATVKCHRLAQWKVALPVGTRCAIRPLSAR